jgi:hypothetical protein
MQLPERNPTQADIFFMNLNRNSLFSCAARYFGFSAPSSLCEKA